MGLGEFELIDRFFSRRGAIRDDVLLGIGDDAALVRVPPDSDLVVAADTLVSGAHFPAATAPEWIGYRALAVNLSDLAAMGATPAWCTLALTLPCADENWLASFSRGLFELAVEHRVALIGGDTTAGPLTISVQILGHVPQGQAIRRQGARAGDGIYVTGSPGDAAAGLALLEERAAVADPGDRDFLEQRFLRPTPRVACGLALRGLATAAIDVSDGLHADLGKLLSASGVGARLELQRLPLSAPLLRGFGPQTARTHALQGGDDYELCFTVPASGSEALERQFDQLQCAIQRIGTVEERAGLRCFDSDRPVAIDAGGFDHFKP